MQFGVDHSGPLPHADQAVVPFFGLLPRCRSWRAGAVIADGQSDGAIGPYVESHGDVLSIGVLERVGECFLGDTVQGRCLLVGELHPAGHAAVPRDGR